jgi:hypothetical protein
MTSVESVEHINFLCIVPRRTLPLKIVIQNILLLNLHLFSFAKINGISLKKDYTRKLFLLPFKSIAAIES